MDLTAIPFIEARWFQAGRASGDPKIVVIHCTQGSRRPGSARSQAADFAHRLSTNKASAHYIVDSEEVIQAVHDKDTAWHCVGVNQISIGIEHCGFANDPEKNDTAGPHYAPDDWTGDDVKPMLELSAQLAAARCADFNIPIKAADPNDIASGGFIQHRDVIGHGGHWDVSPDFPMAWYLSRVRYYFEQAKTGGPDPQPPPQG